MDIRRSAPEEQLRAYVRGVFSAFDVDGSGDISQQEFQDFLYSLGEIMDDQAAASAFAAIDTDASGSISFEEFFDWWKKSGIDSSSSKSATADPTASLQAKLASRNLVRYLADSLVKARAGISEQSDKDELKLDLTVVAGQIQRFAEKNTRVQVKLLQDEEAQTAQPSVELAFSLLEGSDATAVDAKIRAAVREAVETAKAISPAFAGTDYGLRKSADGSKQEYFFKIPLPEVPSKVAGLAKMVGFGLNVDVEVSTDPESNDVGALFVNLSGQLSRSLIDIASNLPLPLPKPILSFVKNMNRFSTTLDFKSFKELRGTKADQPLLDKAKMAKGLAKKFFASQDSNPLAPLMAEVYFAVQENLRFVDRIFLISTGVKLDVKVHAASDWTFQSKLPNRSEVEEARPALKHFVKSLENIKQADGRPAGELEGWCPSMEDEEVEVFVRWVKKSEFDKDRQPDYRLCVSALKTSEEFFKSQMATQEIPEVVASGEDDTGAWQVLSWAHDKDWETHKPLEVQHIPMMNLDVVRSAISKLVRRVEDVQKNGWSVRYIHPSDIWIGKTKDRQVVVRFLRANYAIQAETISPFAEPTLQCSFDVRPPELKSFEDYNNKVDIWFLGILTFALLNWGVEPDSTDDVLPLYKLSEDYLTEETKEWFSNTVTPLENRCSIEQATSLGFISWAPWCLPEDPMENLANSDLQDI